MNIQALMQQAQKMQKEILKEKEELNNKVFVEENDFVVLEMYGSRKVKLITIKKQVLEEDFEIFSDLLQITINKINDKIDKENNDKMSKYGQGLNGII